MSRVSLLPRFFALFATLASTLLLAGAAHAHQPDIPKEIPPAYLSECGSCHVAYLPALLPASAWQQVMQGLAQHYGDNASLDDAPRAQLEKFLVDNAGERWRGLFGAGEPPRISKTFNHRVHHLALPERIIEDRRVRSRGNCAACHAKAEKGLFDKYDLTEIPAEYEVNKAKPPLTLP